MEPENRWCSQSGYEPCALPSWFCRSLCELGQVLSPL